MGNERDLKSVSLRTNRGNSIEGHGPYLTQERKDDNMVIIKTLEGVFIACRIGESFGVTRKPSKKLKAGLHLPVRRTC